MLPRVAGFPQRASELMHVTHAVVPARVAHLLRVEPQLAAAAVEAFHYRTPDDVKVGCKRAGVQAVAAFYLRGWQAFKRICTRQVFHQLLVPFTAPFRPALLCTAQRFRRLRPHPLLSQPG